MIQVGDKLTTLEQSAFSNCRSLTTINLPVKEIGAQAFSNCWNLQYVTLPNAKIVYNAAFGFCTSLKTVDLPNLEETCLIGNYSGPGTEIFTGCSALETVKVPKVTKISCGLFPYYQNKCENLSEIMLGKARDIYVSLSQVFGSSEDRNTSLTIYFANGEESDFTNAIKGTTEYVNNAINQQGALKYLGLYNNCTLSKYPPN